MTSKSIGIILAAFAGGVIIIALAMQAGSGWQLNGHYTGISDASHMPTDTTNCSPFQTGCKNTSYPSVSLSNPNP